MYVKIKNPERSAMVASFVTLGVLSTLVLVIILWLILTAGSVALAWQQAVGLFNEFKQDEGTFKAAFVACGLLLPPIGLIVGIFEWYQKRRLWDNSTAVRALNFGKDGVTSYTRQKTQFLPYEETRLGVKGELVTVRTKNGSHAALNALSLTFTQNKNSFTVRHKPTLDFLYRLADLHPYFKQLSFDFIPSSHDEDQKELASFLKEQIENQRRFGLHRRYRSYFILTVCGVLFIAMGIGALCMIVAFGLNPRMFMEWVFLVLGLGMLTGGISLICGVLRDSAVSRQIKQLRASRSN